MEHFLLSDTEKEELKQFIGAEAELPDMLNARERRVWVQENLHPEYSGFCEGPALCAGDL